AGELACTKQAYVAFVRRDVINDRGRGGSTLRYADLAQRLLLELDLSTRAPLAVGVPLSPRSTVKVRHQFILKGGVESLATTLGDRTRPRKPPRPHPAWRPGAARGAPMKPTRVTTSLIQKCIESPQRGVFIETRCAQRECHR